MSYVPIIIIISRINYVFLQYRESVIGNADLESTNFWQQVSYITHVVVSMDPAAASTAQDFFVPNFSSWIFKKFLKCSIGVKGLR